MRRIALVLCALCLVSMAAPAFAFEVGARGTYWFPKLSGTARSDQQGLQGTEFDIKDDLGMENKGIPGGQAFIHAGNWHFRLGYAQVTFDGDRNVNRTITFGGQTFTAGERVVSRLETKMVDGEVQYDILAPDLVAASFNLGVLLRVKYFDGSVDLSVAGDNTASEDFKLPIPMLGVAAGVGFFKNFVRVDANVAGMGYGGSHLYEADAYASLIPFPFMRLQGGYRYMDLKVDDAPDIVASIKLKGPYAGLQIAF